MASSARMDELRKKFDENPRRYFAPLANEYRKVGDLEQAIFICQEYLPQQPGHMSGHIVYGQALFESGRLDEARGVFETALGLDPENLIALRHLGDIALGAADPEGARQWYKRVLEADPRNEEIAALLDTLPASDAPAAGESAAPSFSEARTVEVPAMPSVDAPADPPTLLETELSIERSEATPDGEASVFEAAVESISDAETGFYEQALDLELTIPEAGVESAPASAPVDFLADEPPPAEPLPAPAGVTDDGLLDLEDFALPGGSPPPSETDLAFSDPYGGVLGVADEGSMSGEAPPLDTPAESFPEPQAGVDDQALYQAAAPELEPASESPAESPEVAPVPEAFVTETMAELYLRQGHIPEALDLYDRLMAQRPYDDALAARAAAARQQVVGGPTIREYLRSIFHGAGASGGGEALDRAASVWPGGASDSADDAMAAAYARGFGSEQS